MEEICVLSSVSSCGPYFRDNSLYRVSVLEKRKVGDIFPTLIADDFFADLSEKWLIEKRAGIKLQVRIILALFKIFKFQIKLTFRAMIQFVRGIDLNWENVGKPENVAITQITNMNPLPKNQNFPIFDHLHWSNLKRYMILMTHFRYLPRFAAIIVTPSVKTFQ